MRPRLTLGIGTVSAMFSVVNTMLLKPLAGVDTERIVKLWEKFPSGAGEPQQLAAAGVNGVVGYATSQRGREMGIRMAPGARPGQLFSLVTRQAAGAVIVPVAANELFGTRPFPPAIFLCIVS